MREVTIYGITFIHGLALWPSERFDGVSRGSFPDFQTVVIQSKLTAWSSLKIAARSFHLSAVGGWRHIGESKLRPVRVQTR
jgi:hypothetical protein